MTLASMPALACPHSLNHRLRGYLSGGGGIPNPRMTLTAIAGFQRSLGARGSKSEVRPGLPTTENGVKWRDCRVATAVTAPVKPMVRKGSTVRVRWRASLFRCG